MSTNMKVKDAPATDGALINLTAEDRLRVYSPEEVVELKLLPCKVRWLKEMAYARKIPATKVAGKLGFRLDHILAISMAGDIGPAQARGKRAA